MSSAEETRLPLPQAWETFAQKALYWASSFTHCILLDSHAQSTHQGAVEWLLAADALEVFDATAQQPQDWESLFAFARQGMIFGRISFDVYASIFSLADTRPGADPSGFHFFRPRFVLQKKGDRLVVNRRTPEALAILQAIEQTLIPSREAVAAEVECLTDRETYLTHVEEIQERIREGDLYEINYCVPFRVAGWRNNPVGLFLRANERNASPMSAFYRYGDRYILCTSPERFLQRQGNRLLAQPIKGTIRRAVDPEENAALCRQLAESDKERAENIMIVDLVRHDLAQSCKPGTVEVDELCGIYSFKRVNHMISSIRGEIRADVTPGSVLRSAFPMGSMTGAPKREVLRQLPGWEERHRGDYSGSMGYVSPEGDFDFNVVIRSFFYDAATQELLFWSGSAITLDANPAAEWEEIQLKIAPLREALQNG